VNAALAICGLALSLLTSVVAVTAVIVQMRANMDTLKTQAKAHDDREDRATAEIRDLLVTLKSFIAEQTQINKTWAMAMEGAIRKLEEMEKRTIESSAVVALLTEVLGRKTTKIEGMKIEP
jgi:hypothetical protein